MEKKMSVFTVEYIVLFGCEEVAGGITLFFKKEDALDYFKKHFEKVKTEIEKTGEEILFVSSYSDTCGSAMIETDCSTHEWWIYEKVVF